MIQQWDNFIEYKCQKPIHFKDICGVIIQCDMMAK